MTQPLRSIRLDNGVALVLVLLVVTVLSALMLQIGIGAKERVRQAERVLARVDAELAIESRESRLLFELWTKSWDIPREPVAGKLPPSWNFAGSPFEWQGAVISIQDMAGLYPLPTRLQDIDGIRPILSGLVKLPPDEVDRSINVLTTLMSDPTWIGFQSLSELRSYKVVSDEALADLGRYVTLYPTLFFNPTAAPAGLLAMRYSASQNAALDALRSNNELERSEFFKVTGIDDEYMIFSPSPVLSINTRWSVGGITSGRHAVWIVRPYGPEPARRWSVRRVDSREW